MYIHILSFFCSIWTPPLRIANKMVYCVLSFISPLANSCRAYISFDNSVNPQFKTAFDCNLRGRKHFKIELPTFFCLTPLSGLKGAVHSLWFIVHPNERTRQRRGNHLFALYYVFGNIRRFHLKILKFLKPAREAEFTGICFLFMTTYVSICQLSLACV